MTETNAILTSISTFAALLAGISVATERVVEMIKGAVPILANAWKDHDEIRAGILQLIAAVTGAVIASQMPDQIKNAMPAGWGSQLHWQGYTVIGLMASGGSGAWNHALDILGAFKAKQEESAQEATTRTPMAAAASASGSAQ